MKSKQCTWWTGHNFTKWTAKDEIKRVDQYNNRIELEIVEQKRCKLCGLLLIRRVKL